MPERPHTVDDRAPISSELILPLLFPEDSGATDPILILVDRPPGATAAPAIGSLVDEHGPEIAVISGDELRQMHPSAGDADVGGDVAQDAAEWVLAALTFGRENRRSLIVEGHFSPAAALGTAQRFADAGFRTRVVLCGARRAQSLLAAVSEFLRQERGRTDSFTGRDVVDGHVAGARALTLALEEAAGVDRVTVLGHSGRTVFDASRAETMRPFAGASAALQAAAAERMSSLQSAQWLSELRRVTEVTASLRRRPAGLTEALIDLHDTALREVIPELPVPGGSAAVTRLEGRVAADLVSLRRSLTPEQPVDGAAPAVSSPSPDRGRPSR